MNEHKENASHIIFRAVNGSPAQNINKIVEMIGGIQNIIGTDDIVVIKLNAQWWNQGVPNLSALKAFVDLIMEHPGRFKGEVVLGENCHRGPYPWKSLDSAWAHPFDLNSDVNLLKNLNDVCSHLKKRYASRFSTVHWIDVADGGRRVFSPAEGIGYVYCDGTGGIPLLKCSNGLSEDHSRETIMTYPIFSTDRGTLIDFKNGVWTKGTYTGQPLRLINFAALNHHSVYCGATSAIKNYMGITDLSGGPDPNEGGRLTDNYYNFHSFPFNKWASGPEPGILGKEIGVFLKAIRKADLNITTAEWIGLSSRTDPPVAHTRAVLACTDPVALDYHATKYLLFPNSKLPIHNPDNEKSPLHQYLKRCAKEYGGVFDECYVAVKSYDFEKNGLQEYSDMIVWGAKHWGNSIKPILKYLLLRYFG